MITQTKGKIFLGDERGVVETERFRCLHTFNYGKFQHEHKDAFGALYAFGEITLAGGEMLKWPVPAATAVIILPVVGTVEVKNNCGHLDVVAAGNIKVLTVPSGSSFDVRNPFNVDLIKYLHIWVKMPNDSGLITFKKSFDLQNYKLNHLLNLPFPYHETLQLAIIKLKGRQEEIYIRRNNDTALFAFVIQGALEVQNRLMHEGDGLALWDADDMEFEALSNEAILLVVEPIVS